MNQMNEHNIYLIIEGLRKILDFFLNLNKNDFNVD
jgi:phosphopantetheine adenylyltransferase